MKKRLNIITFLIGIAVGLSIVNSEDAAVYKMSFMMGMESGSNGMTSSGIIKPSVLRLAPIGDKFLPDNILNKKNGELIPMSINTAIVTIPTGEAYFLDIIWIFFGSILGLSGYIMFIYNFFKIIISVNRSIIFEWINVKRLRRIGIGFVIVFVSNIFIGILSKSTIVGLVELENYTIVNSLYEGGALMLGMVAFLVAEIFAVGLKLREEQELTI